MKKPLAAEWFVWADGSCAGGGHRFTELYSYTAGGLTTVKKLYVKLNDTNWPNAIADLGVMRQLDYSWGQTAQVYQMTMTYPADSGGNRRQLTYAYDGMPRPSVLTEGSPVPLITGIPTDRAMR